MKVKESGQQKAIMANYNSTVFKDATEGGTCPHRNAKKILLHSLCGETLE